jgi:hypothetical protein
MVVRPNPADPRDMAKRAAAIALFAPYPGERGPRSILAESLDGVDRALLLPAVEKLLQNQDSVARASVGKVLDDLTQQDLAVLLPAIVRAVEHLAPSNEMFGDGIRLAGLDLLSRLHLRDGMRLCLTVLEPERWGLGNRIKPCLDYLPRYGTHAQALLPDLKRLRADLVAKDGKRVNQEHLALLDRCISAIENATTTPTLVSVGEFTPKK